MPVWETWGYRNPGSTVAAGKGKMHETLIFFAQFPGFNRLANSPLLADILIASFQAECIANMSTLLNSNMSSRNHSDSCDTTSPAKAKYLMPKLKLVLSGS